MPDSLVQPLFDGPIDIVSDIHGEINALRDLLGHTRNNFYIQSHHPLRETLILQRSCFTSTFILIQ